MEAHAVFDVLSHFRRQAEAGEHHFALEALVGEHFASCRNADGGRGDDDLQVRIGAEEPFGLGYGLVAQVIAIGDLDELEVFVFGLCQLFLHEVDPDVLVGSLARRGENGDFAFTACHVVRSLDEGLADLLGVRLVDVGKACLGIDRGIEREDFDSLRGRFFEDRDEGIVVVADDADRSDFLGNQLLDDLNLRLSGGQIRSAENRRWQFDSIPMCRPSIPPIPRLREKKRGPLCCFRYRSI